METSQKYPSLAYGRTIIKRYQDNLPDTPGVYRMLDNEGTILYIGKAKNLRNRVGNYVNVGALNTRLQKMVSQTYSMEIISTRSEAEALLLEANLIKKFAPRYNILLKDSKSFPYIFFSGDHEYSRISKHRGAKVKPGKYFGPFVSAKAVDDTLTLLQKAFLLRPCSDNVFKNRTRPCLQFQIKRCSAPCVNRISIEDYEMQVKQAQDFLAGDTKHIQDTLVAEMQRLSLKMDYEKASVLRDRIRALTHVTQEQGMVTAVVGDADIIACARKGNDCCVQLFSFRGGRNYGDRTWFPAYAGELGEAEILRHFIGQHYQSQPAPALILTSHLLPDATLLEEALCLNKDYKVEIVQPLRGPKRDLLEQVKRNAQEALMRHIAVHVAQRAVLDKIKELFELEDIPTRIEVYDNSHIMGSHAVGAMIVAGPNGYMRNEYRKFDIKREDTTPGDDYAMLREVLSRRFKDFQHAPSEDDEDTQSDAKKPDLILIDGGLGQVSAAKQVFEELGIQGLVYVGIAKGPDRNAGREQFFVPGKEPFQLPENDPVLHHLQRLRDEAHRFAIGAHRKKRSKSMKTSELDAISFIGPNRKKALLHHFGSAKEVSAASIEEIQKVQGISKTMAKVIYQHFHGAE